MLGVAAANLLLIALFPSTLSIVDFSRCSFEAGFCGWNQASREPSIRWQIGSNVVTRGSRGVSVEGRGHFVYAASSGQFPANGHISGQLPGRVVLESGLLVTSDNVCGVKFSFYREGYGGQDATLSVQPVKGRPNINGKALKAVVLHHTFGSWQRLFFPLHIDSSSVVKFEMFINSFFGDLLALDDIQFISCSVCSFEDGVCGWHNVRARSWRSQTQWTRHFGPTYSHNTGPDGDYTLRSPTGHYLYVRARRNYRKLAITAGRDLSYSDNVCGVSWAYHMYGMRSGSLTVTIQTVSGRVINSWKIKGNQGDKWRQAELTTDFWNDHRNRVDKLRVYIKAVIGDYDTSDVAVDDVEYMPCVSTQECTFGLDFCSWRNSRQATLQWQLELNKTDVTHNHLLVNVDGQNKGGELACLVGSWINSSDNICSLRITYKLEGHFSEGEMVVRSHHQHQYTNHENVTNLMNSENDGMLVEEIALYDFPLFVSIEARKKDGAQGNAIIDSLQYLTCHYSTFEQNTSLIWHDASPLASNFRWNLQTQLSLSDHLHFGRKFITTSGPGLARLHSDIHRVQQAMCSIRFWYTSRHCYNITIISHHYSTPGYHHFLAVAADEWERVEAVIIDPRSQPSVSDVTIEASPVGDGQNAQLGIDNIELLSCPDFETCTFDRDFCTWHASVHDSRDAVWIRWYGNPPQYTSRLINDHTRHAVNGYYLYARASVGRNNNESIAVLRSVPMSPGMHICGVQLWYFVMNDDYVLSTSANLSVRFVSHSGDSSVLLRSTTLPQYPITEWHLLQAEHHVVEQGHFQVIADISVQSEMSNPVAIAVDDVTYMNCFHTNADVSSTSFPTVASEVTFQRDSLDLMCPELSNHPSDSNLPTLSSLVHHYGHLEPQISYMNLSPSSFHTETLDTSFSKPSESHKSEATLTRLESTALLFVGNVSETSGLGDGKDFPVVAAVAGACSLLLVLVLLVVVLVVAIRRKSYREIKSTEPTMEPVSPTTPSIYVKEMTVQPTIENLYAATDPSESVYEDIDKEAIYAVPQPRHLRKKQTENGEHGASTSESARSQQPMQSENVLYGSTLPSGTWSLSSSRTEDNVLYQSFHGES